MYYLRLARGYRSLDLARWLLTATAAAVVAAFLLRALGRALHGTGGNLERLLWCLPPLAAVGWFAAVAARAVPAQHPERVAGLTAAGAGPARIRALVAGETAVACALGSALTLLLFLILRNDIAGPGLAADIGMGVPLPAAAPVALLAVLPLVAGVSAAAAIRFPESLPGRPAEPGRHRYGALRLLLPAPVLLAGAGLELYGLRPDATDAERTLALPGGLPATSPALLVGWALAALALALWTGPLLALAGLLLALRRPAPLRLLAGRTLAAQARRLGAPLAVLTAVVALLLVAWRDGARTGADVPALNLVESLLVLACAIAALAARLHELRADRRPALDALDRLGTPPALLTGAAALRVLAAGSVLLLTGGLTVLLCPLR
ncbi:MULTISPECIES: hypothetical protein [Kitasatospora]|uniref:Uncharacterized protein n=1 Tax=Kitasatospora setae (strain ATCC 33774 / DSM 43861 / JCM 3304 / KCC A-0304 / NBRC 14216 / KM-6054) TaxID=452652 RepID=E4NHQ9_KITSK|nr:MULTISPECIES: hypothetical protein [Kitasatospora]BAJ31039.1 hypothetical protein KSE_52630 [Kitasatospora setae KM-6054]